MSKGIIGRAFVGAILMGMLVASPARPQTRLRLPRAPEPVRPPLPEGPRLEAVAETRLLMEGINQPNFQGLQRNLRQEPASNEAWTFLRGQALLIAETGNLLMIRPPHNEGQSTWMAQAIAQRQAGTKLAKAAAERDYVKCRTALVDLTNACNRCHQTFQVKTRLEPFALPAVPNKVNAN